MPRTADIFVIYDRQFHKDIKSYEVSIANAGLPIFIHELGSVTEILGYSERHQITPNIIILSEEHLCKNNGKINLKNEFLNGHNVLVVAGEQSAKVLKEDISGFLQVVSRENLPDYLVYKVSPAITKGAAISAEPDISDEKVIKLAKHEQGNQVLKNGNGGNQKEEKPKKFQFEKFIHPVISDKYNYQETAEYANTVYAEKVGGVLRRNIALAKQNKDLEFRADFKVSIKPLSDDTLSKMNIEPQLYTLTIPFKDGSKSFSEDRGLFTYISIDFNRKNPDEKRVLFEKIVEIFREFEITGLDEDYRLKNHATNKGAAAFLAGRFNYGNSNKRAF
jgi:hypothetical protein